MEKFDERRAAEALRHFDAVWKRVGAARSAQSQADRCGVVLMPRRQYKKPEREGNPVGLSMMCDRVGKRRKGLFR